MTWLLLPSIVAAPFLVLAARLARGYAIRRRRKRLLDMAQFRWRVPR